MVRHFIRARINKETHSKSYIDNKLECCRGFFGDKFELNGSQNDLLTMSVSFVRIIFESYLVNIYDRLLLTDIYSHPSFFTVHWERNQAHLALQTR